MCEATPLLTFTWKCDVLLVNDRCAEYFASSLISLDETLFGHLKGSRVGQQEW